MPAGSTGPAHAAHRRRGVGRRTALVVLPLVVCLTAVAVALAVRSPDAVQQTTPAAGSPSSDPAQEAASWLSDQASQNGPVVVDPSLYEAVAGSSALASRLVQVPLGATAEGPPPASSTDGTSSEVAGARWLVAGPELRAGAVAGSWAAQALATSRTVVVFGEGDDRVEVREITGASSSASSTSTASTSAASTPAATAVPPSVTSGPPRASATAASEESLRQLLANPRLDFSPRARQAVTAVPVDLRLASLLAQLAVEQPLSVADVPGSGSTDAEPVRSVVLDGVAGERVGADPEALQSLERQLSAQDPAYRATVTEQQDGTVPTLLVVLPPAGA